MDNIENKFKNLRSLVGNTPLVRLMATINGQEKEIFAKYEAFNFSGSIKDRMALQILEAAYHLGTLKAGDTIVEATSGNTGIAFAAMGAFLGHPVQILMPSWLSEERKQLLRFYGAQLTEISAKEGGFAHCIALANQKSQKKGYFGPKQFENSWNVLAHMKTTAPEVEATLEAFNLGKLDIFTAGMGTGGTLMGFLRYFSPKNANFQVFPILPSKNKDGEHKIEGIGDSFIPSIVNLDELQPIRRVKDEDAINVARKINKLGLSVGISSGANVFGALVQALHEDPGTNIATILCDDNKKYLTTDLCSNVALTPSHEIEILDFEIIS